MYRTPPATNKMVGTRSTVQREREQQLAIASGVKTEEQPAHPPSSSSKKSGSRNIIVKPPSASTSVKARRAQLLLEAAQEKAQLQMELIDKKLAVDLAELDSNSSQSLADMEPAESEVGSRVEKWLQTSQEVKTQCVTIGNDDDALCPAHRQDAILQQMGDAGPLPPVTENTSQQHRPLPVMTPMRNGTEDTMHMLACALKDLAAAATTNANQPGTNVKMLNRLCTPKDLPKYDGDPLEWLQFKQAYEESSQVCNFSDRENLWRLRKSLHGRAKEAVTALLIGATSPDVVMSTLQLQFGNNDIIISRILQDISKLRPMSQEYHKEIVSFSIKVKNCVAAVTAIGCEDYLKGMNIVSTVLSKLPTVLISKWTDYCYPLLSENAKPKLVILSEFLSAEAQKITQCSVNISFVQNYKNSNNDKYKSQIVLLNENKHSENENRSTKCGFCPFKNHALPDCKKFKKALRKDRWTYVKRHGVCFKCLTSRHNKESCPATACDIDNCGQLHHRLLHYNVNKNNVEVPSTSENESKPPETDTPVETVTYINKCNKVLLKTVPILIHGPKGTSRSVALLDDGSTVTLISDELASRVGLHGYKQSMRVCGAWDNTELVCDSEIININLSNIEDNNKFTIKARSVKNLNLPVQNQSSVNLNDYELRPEIKSVISDGQCKPEILIGQDNYHLLLPLEIIKGKLTEPYVTRTPLGWCIHGRVRASSLDMKATPTLQSTLFINEEDCEPSETERILRDIHEEIRQSYSLESLGVSNKPRQNADDVRAWEHLERSSKLIDGRWYVGLPWKDPKSTMPDSRTNAIRRLCGVEKKMKSSDDYATRYQERIVHLLTNDYASQIETKEDAKRTWYLPHFGVDNPNKQKLRLVFDAAATSNGVCLNDYILKGPDLLVSLYGTMLRFREHKIAVTGDIRDMFLRIKIIKEDRDTLRFLWRKSPEHEVNIYAMSSLIFGANCSPFIAQFIKNKNAELHKSTMPSAVQAIQKQFYMDDYIDSFEEEKTATKTVNEVSYIHSRGGFDIRNWTSNHQVILNNLPQESLRATEVKFKIGQQYDGERTLGLMWNPKDDTLGFDVSFKRIPAHIIAGQKKPTKREMLKVIMSIFDVFGFLAPFTIKGKIMLQDTWRSGISWDDEIPDEIYAKWSEWLNVLKYINTIRLPRHYESATRTTTTSATRPTASTRSAETATMDDDARASETADGPSASALNSDTYERSGYTNLQLHVFCDASTKAMCAVAYWRWLDNNKQVRVAFVSSKCRVAPVKYVSVPRLELQAALIGSRLAETLINEHRIKTVKKYMWCDSATVLHWIRNDRRTYKAYIAHRLGEIDEYTQMKDWRYIPTKMNVADAATREFCEVETLENEWLYGPAFLYEDESLWPLEADVQLAEVSNMDLECINTLRVTPICLPAVPEPSRFSSWLRILRSTCVVLSFIEKCKKLTGDVDGAIMGRAEVLLLKYSQMKSFPEDIENLQKKKALDKKSKLLTLSPFIDDDGVLRVGGRITAAPAITRDIKQPVILDGRSHIAHLIVKHYHQKASHGNQEMVVNELKQKYWIIRLRPTVKYITSKCMFCRIKKAQPHPPRMGDLPEARMAHHQSPFTFTGVDLFGPMEITTGRRREKVYGVIFTCLTVRAVHIELVSSLTTDALIMALRRMAARRGWPRRLYSDNGTNLKGADKELRKSILELDEEQLKKEALNYSLTTTWTFIPPASPHWGGAWERLIRNIKCSLKVILKERAPRYETLHTLMTEVEHIVNSRPLTHVSVEPNTDESLTPNHFLLGTASNLPVLGTYDDSDLHLRKQWRISQRLADMYWKRWVREVLPDMRPRQKWNEEQRPLKVGDLALVVDPNSPRNTWPRGVIQDVLPGKDGRIRVVNIKTRTGVLQRPAARVARIAMGDECCVSTGEGNVGDAST